MKRLNQTQLTATHTDNENKGEIPAVGMSDIIGWKSALLRKWIRDTEQGEGRLPSRSSMVFSSLATVLSANSARVSICGGNEDENDLMRYSCYHFTIRLWFTVAHSEILAWKSIKINSCVCCWVQTTHLFQFISENFDLLFIFVFFLWILHIENKQNLI